MLATNVHKSWSLWATALLGFFDAVHLAMPTVQAYIPPDKFALVNLVMIGAIAGLRVIKQSNMSPEPPQPAGEFADAKPGDLDGPNDPK